jgi:hypothetical protein
MKKRLMVGLIAGGLMVAMAIPALAAGPTDRAMGTVFFDDEVGVPHRLTFTVKEADPSEGFVRWTALDGSGWQELLDIIYTVDVDGSEAEFQGVNEEGFIWLFTVVDGGSPATDGDSLTWTDPLGFVQVATMTGGNLKVIDRDNGQ